MFKIMGICEKKNKFLRTLEKCNDICYNGTGMEKSSLNCIIWLFPDKISIW